MSAYQQLRDTGYHAIADVYTDSDPRFQSWVRENMQNKDHMEQMNQILATNAHTKRPGENNEDYTKQYIERGLFNQIDFKGGSHRKRSHRKRSHRKRSHKKRSHKKRSHKKRSHKKRS
jgi:hypothetical protein